MPAIPVVIFVALARMASAILEHHTAIDVDQEEISTSANAVEQSQSALTEIAGRMGSGGCDHAGPCPNQFNPVGHNTCPWPASTDEMGQLLQKGTDTLSLWQWCDPNAPNPYLSVVKVPPCIKVTKDGREFEGEDDWNTYKFFTHRCDNNGGSDFADFATLLWGAKDVRAYQKRLEADSNHNTDSSKCNSNSAYCCGEGKWVHSRNDGCTKENIDAAFESMR